MKTTTKQFPAFATAMLFASSLLTCLTLRPALAQTPDATVPRAVNYAGTAKDIDGKPLAGVVGATFAVYAEQSGGAPVWMETQNIAASASGKFAVVLGATQSSGIPMEVFSNGQGRWLGVSYNGGPEQPRVALLSVPYALKAGDAQTIGGLPPSAFVLATSVVGNTPQSSRADADNATATTAVQPAAGSNVTTTGGNLNTLPLFTSSTNIQSSAITQTGSGTTAKIGINTSTPATALDVKGGATIRGALSLPATGTATAAAGANSQPEKLTASAFNSTNGTAASQTFEWQAEPAGNNTAGPSGTMNLLFGSNGATPTETGLRISSQGLFTFASGQVFPGTSTITGVTAGTDLTGGGSSGNITLNLNISATDARYAQLGGANSFTGNQTVTGNVTSSAVVQGVQGFFTNATGAVPVEAVENDTTRVDDAIAGIIYSAQAGSAGVEGTALARSGQVFGVEGTAQSTSAFGVYGVDSARSTEGSNNGGSGGVWGDAGSIGAEGILATADNAYGVVAINNSGPFVAVEAENVSQTGQATGIYGASLSVTGTGILGQSVRESNTYMASAGTVPMGVYGDTGAAGGVGVLGTADSGYAVYGLNNGSYVTGLFINQSSAASYALEAGTFSRHCTIDTSGDLQCTGSTSAVAALPDQRQVRLYAVQSPENWFEDFGSGQLSNGRAVITLEPTFAQTVNTGAEYHVFLTPNGDSRGLYVTGKNATSFEVHEQGGGTSSVTFDYRIVARRTGYENVRLADVTESQNRLNAAAKQLTDRHDNAQSRTVQTHTIGSRLAAK